MRISDWSSDVCSSDLILQCIDLLLKRAIARIQLGKVQRTDSRRVALPFTQLAFQVLTLVQTVGRALGPVHGRLQVCDSGRELEQRGIGRLDRKSVVEGKCVSVLVGRGGRRILTKTKKKTKQ